jgi:daunorubicin resistance ABC transporter ATP-binding subunit
MSDPAIHVEDVSKSFETVHAVDSVSFAVPKGTIFGLLGPNGAGKTTLVRVLSTLLLPDSGRAAVMGFDVVRRPDEVRYQIGLAGQNAAVDANLTGRENLTLVGRLAQMPRRDAARRAGELLERFDLTAAADRPVRTYSGGMRRRLDVAAALVHEPPVLFLDEPTTGLDIQSRLALWEVIRELVADGATVLLTTQYLEEADQLADRIAVVDRGKLVANDTAGTLKARLANTVIEIGMPDEVTGARAQEVLSGPVSELIQERPEREGSRVRLASRDGSSVLVDVLRLLDSQGLAPETLSVREPSMDDVFLALTGHHVEGEDDGGVS